MTLSMKDISKKIVFAKPSPANRWLQNMFRAVVDTDETGDDALLPALFTFCREAEDLVRAFWLASLCRQALSEASSEFEQKTYGKVSKKGTYL